MTPQDRSEDAECYAEIFQKLLTEGLQHRTYGSYQSFESNYIVTKF